jgi:YVTN family beta-propeller protein
MKAVRIALMGAAVSVLAFSAAGAAGSGYHVVKTVPLGGEGGFDYLNRDPDSGHLFITRGSHVMVVDVASGKLLGDITGLQGVHGTAFAGGKAYISQGGANKVTVVDAKSLAKLAEIDVGLNPDGILYDAASKRIFTFNGRSSDTTAIDAATGKVAGTLALGGKPESASSDGAGTIFVNIENRNELVAFDARTLTIKAHYPLTGCEGPTGQAIDLRNGRIFSGCDDQTVVTDMKTGKVVATIKTGAGTDANRFDPATGYVFASNGQSGTMTVAHQDGPDKYTVLDNVETARGARTMELDPATHQAYVVTQDVKAAEPTADNPRPRPAVVPGSFRLLVLGR